MKFDKETIKTIVISITAGAVLGSGLTLGGVNYVNGMVKQAVKDAQAAHAPATATASPK